MPPVVRTCTNDGFVLTKTTNPQGKTQIHANSKKAWRAMCGVCRGFSNGHDGLKFNSGSKHPPRPGENPRLQKGKGKKQTLEDKSIENQ